MNEATILFFSPDPKVEAPGKPVALTLPDGYSTWAAAWMRGGTVLWVQQKSGIRSYDFTNPAQVKESTLEEPANLEKVPKAILDALRAALDVPGAPAEVDDGSAEKGGEKIKPVGKSRIADRTGKYELAGNSGGQLILKAEPLNPDNTVGPFNPNAFR